MMENGERKMTDVVFRGKRADGKGWAEGRAFVAICVGGKNIIFIVNHGERANASIDENFNLTNIEVFGCKINPETFGVGTGVEDKSGNEIFDGDIIRIAYTAHLFEGNTFIDHVALVEYCDGAFIASTNTGYDDRLIGELPTDVIEIIGNIHDNPELFRNPGQLEVDE